MKRNEILTWFNQHKDSIIGFWEQFLQFASISADPANKPDCDACAAWLDQHLRSSGFNSRLVATPGKPVVLARHEGDPSLPTILIYGHYDVQPVDPLEAWDTPPFEPTWRDDRLYARGAQDNKGQLAYTLCAVDMMIKQQRLKNTVIVLVEGEEEYGSNGLTAVLPDIAPDVQADLLLVHDTCKVQSGAPTIIMGLRGIVHLTAELTGPDHDLHSGVHGGLAPNAAQGIAQLAASLYHADGRVAVDGFYDQVTPPTDTERELAAANPFSPQDYQKLTGAAPEGGVRECPAYERVGFLPSLDVNGIHSGYGGPGMKTVLPAKSSLKLSARLVPDQDPELTLQCIIRHLENHVPPGMQLAITEQAVGGPGFRLPATSDALKRARTSMNSAFPNATPSLLWEGASIPIVAGLAASANAEPLLVGFGTEEDRIHSPNESFSLNQFQDGFLYTATLLQTFNAQAIGS